MMGAFRRESVARSRQRKSKKVKVRQERTFHQVFQRLQERIYQQETAQLTDLVMGILGDCRPATRSEFMDQEEIEHWFDTDPEAPLILYSRPKVAPEGLDREDQIQLSVNQHAVERELRVRGVNESHPLWEDALRTVGLSIGELAWKHMEETTQSLRSSAIKQETLEG